MISKSENFLQVLRGNKPAWIPVECPVDPRYGDGAYQFVCYQGALPPHQGGYDLWGTHWTQVVQEELPYIDAVPLEKLEDILDLHFPELNDDHIWEDVRQIILSVKPEQAVVARQVSSLWERLYFLYGFENSLLALVVNPDLVGKALDLILDWQIKVAEIFISLGVDAVRVSDDYGTQESLLMSPDLWRQLIYPRLKSLIEVYRKANLPVALHSCGNLSLIMDDLVDLDIAAFNIQTNANPIMKYKEKYGDSFRLWGGISTHDELMWGTEDQIAKTVQEAIRKFGSDGNLILEPDQMVKVPDKNLEIFWKTAKQYQRLY